MSAVVIEARAGWLHLRLNKPEIRNALAPDLMAELTDALRAADLDPDVRAVLISGNGPDFCTGHWNPGTSPVQTFEDATLHLEYNLQKQLLTIFEMHKPVVARVHGRCLAGGTDLAILCDMIIAANDSVFGYPPHRDIGHSPFGPMWVYHVGPQWAKRLLLTGDSISGEDAAKIGLVLKAVPPEDLDRETEGLMNRLGKIDRELLATHKRSVNLALELMGTRTMLRVGGEMDARAHLAPTALHYKELTEGRNDAVKRDRLDKFGRGYVRVSEPDDYDEVGRIN